MVCAILVGEKCILRRVGLSDGKMVLVLLVYELCDGVFVGWSSGVVSRIFLLGWAVLSVRVELREFMRRGVWCAVCDLGVGKVMECLCYACGCMICVCRVIVL